MLTSSFVNEPIYLQEIGYQTTAVNNSNQQKQTEFFCNFFRAWDAHSDVIKSANIVRMNDLSEQAAVESAGPYQISDPQFIEYLRTLGIRTYGNNGTNKQAFSIIKNNLSERGW